MQCYYILFAYVEWVFKKPVVAEDTKLSFCQYKCFVMEMIDFSSQNEWYYNGGMYQENTIKIKKTTKAERKHVLVSLLGNQEIEKEKHRMSASYIENQIYVMTNKQQLYVNMNIRQ